MNPSDLAVIVAAYLIAALVKGTSGLGFSTTVLPLLTLAVGLKEAMPLVILPSLSSNLMVMRDAGHFRGTVARFWPLYLASLPGIAIGLAVLAWVDGRTAAAVLGAVLMAYSVFAFAQPALRLPSRLERPLGPPAGLLTGMVNGLTGSQVMPVLPYLLALHLEPNRFVQAINISFTVGSLAMIVGLSRIGLMTAEAALISMIGLVPVYFGLKAGTRLRRRMAPEVFRRVVLAVLLVLGAGLIARPFL